MSDVTILPYSAEHRDRVSAVTIAAWTSVFEKTKQKMPSFVYNAFYPQGRDVRQHADVASLLDQEPENIWLALYQGELAGFLGLRIHSINQMGEIYIVAVSPDVQRRGIAKALLESAERRIRDAGMTMVMVDTAGDSGHEAARLTYEASGYELWPVARYFKRLK